MTEKTISLESPFGTLLNTKLSPNQMIDKATIEMRVKPSARNGSMVTYFSDGHNSLNIFQNGEGKICVGYNSLVFVGTQSIALNEWTHVLIVLNAQGSKVYLNGFLDCSHASRFSHGGTQGSMKIGSNVKGEDVWQGEINEVAFWRKDLDIKERFETSLSNAEHLLEIFKKEDAADTRPLSLAEALLKMGLAGTPQAAATKPVLAPKSNVQKRGAGTLDLELIKGETLPLTELLKAALPTGTELPDFIPNAELNDIYFSMNTGTKTFDARAALKAEWTMPWGFAGLKSSEISLSLKREKQNEQDAMPKISAAVTLKGEHECKLANGLTFKGFEIQLNYNEGGTWTASGNVKTQLLEASYTLGVSLAKSIETTPENVVKNVWTLTLNGEQTKGDLSLDIDNVLSLGLPKAGMTIAAKTVQGTKKTEYEVALSATGTMTLNLLQPYNFEGTMTLAGSNEAIELQFEIEKGDIEIPLPVAGQQIIFSIGLASFGLAANYDGSEAGVEIAVRAGFKNLPKPFSTVFPESVTTTLSVNQQGVGINLSRIFNPIDIKLAPVKVGEITIDLEGLCLDATNLMFVAAGKKMLLSVDLGVGLYDAINKIFGTSSNGAPLVSLFRTVKKDFNGAVIPESLTRFRFGLDSEGGFFATLLSSPLKFLAMSEEEGKSWITLDFGAAGGLKCATPVFKFDGYQFTASGAMQVLRPLQIPTQPLKALLESQGLHKTSAKIPTMLPLKDVNIIDANGKLQVTKLSAYLQDLTGVGLPNELNHIFGELENSVNRLPKDLLEYFRFVMPTELDFDITVTIDGSAKIKFKTDEPLKILIPNLPALTGIRLRSLTFGELFSGSLFLFDTDIEVDMFAPTDLMASLVPSDKIGLKGFIDTHEIRNRFYLKDLMVFIVYQTGVPIPIPVFYDAVGIERKGLDGTHFESSLHFPMPKFNIGELLGTMQDFTKFISDKKHLLDTTQDRKMDLKYTVGKNYLKLPKWLSAEQPVLGFKDSTLTVSAYNSIASLMNAGKTLNPAYLLTAIPLAQRVHQLNVNILGITAKGISLLTTFEEFKNLAHANLNITKTDAERITTELQPLANAVTTRQGFIHFAQGAIHIPNIGTAAGRMTTVGGEKGIAISATYTVKIRDWADLYLAGGTTLNLNPNSKGSVTETGRGYLKVFGNDMFNVDWKQSDTEMYLKADASYFPIAGVNLNGKFDGHLNQQSFGIVGLGTLTVAGYGEPFGKINLNVNANEFRLQGRFLDKNANLLITQDGANFRLSAYLDPINIQGIMSITAHDGHNGASLSVAAGAGVPQIFLDAKVELPILKLSTQTRIHFTAQEAYFSSSTQIIGFSAQVQGRGNLLSPENFKISGVLKDDFLNFLKAEAIKIILSENSKHNQALEGLRNAIQVEQGKLNTLLTEVENARRTVNRERHDAQAKFNAAQSDLNNAQNEVNKIQNEINAKHQWFNALPDIAWPWEFSKAREAASHGIQIAALETAKFVATKALDVAKLAVNATAGVVSNTPIDLDPRVSAPLAAYHIANTALEVLKQQLHNLQAGLGAIKDVGIFIANAGADAILVVERAEFKDVSLSVLKGDELPLALTLRFMQQSKTLNLKLDLDEPHKLVVSLVQSLVQ